MAKEKDKKKITTTLEMDKNCKASKRYRSSDVDEAVTTSIYILNDGWERLGKPTTVKVTVTPVE